MVGAQALSCLYPVHSVNPVQRNKTAQPACLPKDLDGMNRIYWMRKRTARLIARTSAPPVLAARPCPRLSCPSCPKKQNSTASMLTERLGRDEQDLLDEKTNRQAHCPDLSPTRLGRQALSPFILSILSILSKETKQHSQHAYRKTLDGLNRIYWMRKRTARLIARTSAPPVLAARPCPRLSCPKIQAAQPLPDPVQEH
jgi:hypothetical protein